MARRRKSGGAAPTVLLLAAFALIYLLPPALLVGLLGVELWARAGGTDRDRARARYRATAGAAEREALDLVARGDDLGLDTRADGMFDGRSREGRRLNAAIEAAREMQASAEAELRVLTRPLIWRATLRIAAIGWAAGFAIALMGGQPPKAAVLIAGVVALVAGGLGYLTAESADPEEIAT